MTPRRRRGPRLWAAATLVALGAVACGARLPAPVQDQASRAVLREGSGSQPASSSGQGLPTGPVPVESPPVSSGTSGGPLPSTGRSTAPAAGSHQSTQPISSTAPSTAAATCSGGSDTGLTASTLTLGEVVTLTGPVAGLFEGAVQGGETFANYVNSAGGGICGRQVKVDVADDGTNCTQNENATQNLAGKVFALSGSFSLYDQCGASIIRANPDLPDIHVALDPTAKTPPNHFDISAKSAGFATGMFHYYKQKYGAKLDHVGTIVENIPSAVANQDNMVHSAESQGWHFVDSILEEPTNSSFQNDFVKLCQQQHIQVFFELTEPAANVATMIHNERQAGCPSSLVNIIPVAYDQAFIPDYGGSASDLNGIVGWNEYALFFTPSEAAGIPEVKLFQQWFNRTYPGQPINLYAMYAWVDDRLFQQAADSVHGPLTRKSLLAALRRVRNFSDNGMIAPTDPSAAGGPHCYILWKLENGGFERVDDPKTGFRCDGRFLPRPGA